MFTLNREYAAINMGSIPLRVSRVWTMAAVRHYGALHPTTTTSMSPNDLGRASGYSGLLQKKLTEGSKSMDSKSPRPFARATTPPWIGQASSVEVSASRPPELATPSVIGSDLLISGQGIRIESKVRLQVDGTIEGDVVGSEVVIGETGRIVGSVRASSVSVRGVVEGTISGQTVLLTSSSRVIGEVHHTVLEVQNGAHLDARIRRLPPDAPRQSATEQQSTPVATTID